MKIIGVSVRRPSSKAMFLVGCVFLLNVLVFISMSHLEIISIDKESFVMFASAIFAGSFLSACGVSIVDHGFRALIILSVVATALWLALIFIFP